MRTFYEVWDFETRNQIAAFESESDALAFFRKMLDLNGEAGVRELGLLRQDPDSFGEYAPTLVLDGARYLAQIAAHV